MGMESVVRGSTRWFILSINPEPWAVGSLAVGRRDGKVYPYIGPNAQLVAYQEAIREELGDDHELTSGDLKIRFYFWRQLSAYTTTSGRSHRKHQTDTTNLQKALEDALQGILFKNDRAVKDIRSVIVDQGQNVVPKIVISIDTAFDALAEIPGPIWLEIERIDELAFGPPVVQDDDQPYREAGGIF